VTILSRLERRSLQVVDPKDVVRRGYDALSYRYRGDTEEPEHYATWLTRLQERVPAGGAVLDLGCGCGVPLAQDLAAGGYEVIGVDLSAVQVERARRLVPAGRFLHADATQVGFPPSSFDAVVSLYALIHMPLDEQPPLLGRIGRWLRPGGWLLATTGQRTWTGTEDGWLGGRRRCGGAMPMPRPTGLGSSRPAWWWSPRRWFPRGTGRTRCSGLAGRPPVDSPPMTDLDEHGRPEPPLAGDESETLLGFLEFQRATLAWKCSGLDADGLRATTAASSMTLGGMLKHLAYVEDQWFSRWLRGRDPAPPWDTVDWKADRDWDWHSAADDSPEELFTLWRDTLARSRSSVAEALAEGGLDQLARRTWPDGRAPSLRWILVHMVEEYARHNGHADLLRESVDGQTGE
jgi:SAM-dependent methyltransferase